MDAGYIEGQDVVIDWRSAKGDYDLVPQLVADLVQRKVDVIVVTSTPATKVAERATSTIPIVMALVADPVGSGLVASLAHPGGNVTGLSFMTTELSPKRLQLLKETIPQLTQALRFLGFEGATAHGFRSLITDQLYLAQFHYRAIERQLSHADRSEVRSAYLRDDFLDHRRVMMQWWADVCDALEKGKPALKVANVISLRPGVAA